MTTQNLSGQWTGTIIYGKSYKKYAGRELHFNADILHQDNDIVGTAQDIGGLGVNPEAANLLGTFLDNKIIFFKQYPTLHYSENNSEKVNIDKSRPGPKITYTGILNEGNTFSGEWFMSMTFYYLWFIPLRLRHSGTWTMRRI